MIHRRFNLLIALAVLSVFLLSSLLLSSPVRNTLRLPGPQTAPPSSIQEPFSHADTTSTTFTPLHITVTETGGSHDEVVAALVHSFGSQPRAKLDVYQLLPRYGIEDIMATFDLPQKLSSPRRLQSFLSWTEPEQKIPDIWVSATCELDMIRFKENLTMLLEQENTYIFCTVHHADRWAAGTELRKAVTPWLEKGRLEFVALSPHTAEYLQRKSISKWKTTRPALIRYLVPVFPVDLPTEHHGTMDDGENVLLPDAAQEELGFALQGDYDPNRRDYKSLFGRLESFLQSADTEAKKNITMHLLGHGNKPTVPDSIKSHVEFNEHLTYVEYYKIISRTFALVPAFASQHYLDRKASSSVPAALIAGCPLVATEEMMNSYTYLNRDVVWLQEEGEEDMHVIGRVLKMEAEARRRKRLAVRDRRDEIVKENVGRVGGWVEEVLQKVGKSV
ncbi:hypothetical protein BDZ91DRAFT_265134 [Kalaharituber pfeilii]|nr:hypothetical protein BDZ91DRAFT_265134 [Kalaharituber pfeilii]